MSNSGKATLPDRTHSRRSRSGVIRTAIALGDRMVLDDRSLRVWRDRDELFALERTDPGLGILMPFAPT